VKLQIDEGMWNGFDFYYFYLDRINRIIRDFFAFGEGPFGRRPLNPDDPVDPVQVVFFLIRNPFLFFLLKINVSLTIWLDACGQRRRLFWASKYELSR
jgi:urocanate hydratase